MISAGGLCSTGCALRRWWWFGLGTRRNDIVTRDLKLAACVLFLFFIECHSSLQQSFGYLRKQLFHVYSYFCTRFNKLYAEFVCFLLPFVCAYLPFFRIVYFVSHQNNSQIIPSDLTSLVNPPLTVCKRNLWSDIITNYCNTWVVDVTWYQWPKSFLASSVP